MNCLDFRREAQAQPQRLGGEAQAHATGCAGCRAFLERQRTLDAELYDAMSVPVPDGLADRVLVAHGIRRGRAPWYVALAATVVLAAGVAALAPSFISGRDLAGEAIAHVLHEPQSFRLASRHEPGLLATELGRQGVRLARTLGEVTYATLCPMSSGNARHLVVATDAGPVTVFLMPQDGTRRRRTLVESDGMTAIAMSAAQGSITIVAASRAQALAVESSLIHS